MKTLLFVVMVTIVAITFRVLLFGWPEQVYFDDRSSPSGIEYTCMFADKQDFIDVTYEEVHYHEFESQQQ